MQNKQDIKSYRICFDPQKCIGDMNCMRVCPVGAIRIREGKAKYSENKCIECGECIKVCTQGAIYPLTNTISDFQKYKYTVALPSLALYTQFDRNIKPKTILSSLVKIGFNEAYDISRACISVIKAAKKFILEHKENRPFISPFCPTCVKIIQMKYVELATKLIPVISPIELAAKAIRDEISKRMKLDKKDIGIFYITPCSSKLLLISEEDKFYTDVDGAIPFTEIYNSLYTAIYQQKRSSFAEVEHFDVSGFGLNFIKAGGISQMMGIDNSIAVSGINNVLYILDEIEKGKMHNVDFVELNACPESCLGGPMTVENVYIARSNLLSLINYFGETKLPIGKKDEYEIYNLTQDNLFQAVEHNNTKIDIKVALQKMAEKRRVFASLPKINCGACGSPNCEVFADDVANGEAQLFDCVILRNLKLKKMLEDAEFGSSNE